MHEDHFALRRKHKVRGPRQVALSAGRGDAATLHNISVEARQVLDFTGRTNAIEKAVADVIAACERVRAAPTVEQLAEGRYPPAVDEAGLALQRLRALALG